ALTNYHLYSQTLPYVNNFNNLSENIGWKHYAISGSDNWTLSQVYGNLNDFEWTTKGNTGQPDSESEMVLETPNFDISNLTSQHCLSFKHSIQINYGSLNFEYSTDNGNTWRLFIPTTNDKLNWQDSSGFYINSGTTNYKSTISLSSLQGFSKVKFRFKFKTLSYANGFGWTIDDFSIASESYNISARPSKTIEVSPLCTNVKLEGKMIFDTPYENKNYTIKTKIYLSKNQSIDDSDIFLKEIDIPIIYDTFDLNFNLILPSNLQPNNYYIIYKLDDLNVVTENNENDNISFSELKIKPIFTLPYFTDFETNNDSWKSGKANKNSLSIWELGKGKLPHISDTHSGENAWNTSKTLAHNFPEYEYQWVESPYLDLSSISTQKYLSFWYKSHYPSGVDYYNNKYTVQYNTNCSDNIYEWKELYVIPENLSNNWEYVNIPIPTNISSNNNIKFKVTFKNSYVKPEGLIFDDFYVGAARQDLLIDEIRSEKRFSNTSESNYDLNFKINNSGMVEANNVKIKFYFSQDSILDTSDIELGNKIITSLPSQSNLVESFNFVKPNINGNKFYVFYKIDYENQIIEINENNNIGSFEIENIIKKTVPYFNDFEVDTSDWNNNSTLGSNDWNLGSANGEILNTAFSGKKAWITNANNKLTEFSRMHLYTPVFDLSNLNKPVLEFDMLSDVNNGHYAGCNISYSIDNGKTWNILLPSNESYSKWHQIFTTNLFSGIDEPYEIRSSKFFFNREETILSSHKDMNTRDIDKNTHYTIDISNLKCSNIRFRYNVVMNKIDLTTYPSKFEGVLIDNFSIKEAESDLSVPLSKDLYLGSNASKIKFTIDIKNNGNDITPQSKIKYYLSNDTSFSNDDYAIGENIIKDIKPGFKSHFNNDFSLPSTISNYNFLIYVLDPDNTVLESNESNNIGFWNLKLGGVTHYPYTEDFNGDSINGWYGYSVTQFGSTTKTAFRVVNKLYPAETLNYQERIYDGVYRTENPAYGWGMSTPEVFFYMESPTFDFRNQTNPLYISFDIMSSGYSYKTGSNIEYTTNDGKTWTVLGKTYDANAINWYNTGYGTNGLTQMNNEFGWSSLNGDILTVKKDISFLLGSPNVKFRIKGDGMAAASNYHPQGIRIDNFVIGDQNSVDNYACIVKTPSITHFDNSDSNCWVTTSDVNTLFNKNTNSVAWTRVNNFSNESDNNSFKIDLLNQGNNNGTWLISPKYLTTDNVLRFKIALTKKGSFDTGNFDSDDKIILKISSNNGASWSDIHHWDINTPQISNTGETIELPLPENGLYQFGFWATNGTINENSETSFYVDDFEITSQNLNTNNLQKNKFTYYPNPFNNLMNVNSEKEIT
ncbi:hypothetical protein BWK58_14420, partial [Flavobacterium columnare]